MGGRCERARATSRGEGRRWKVGPGGGLRELQTGARRAGEDEGGRAPVGCEREKRRADKPDEATDDACKGTGSETRAGAREPQAEAGGELG